MMKPKSRKLLWFNSMSLGNVNYYIEESAKHELAEIILIMTLKAASL